MAHSRELHVCGFRHIRDNRPQSLAMTFDELAARLETPQVLDRPCLTPKKCGVACLGKCNCPGLTGAKFRGKRSKANVEELDLLCFDFDNEGPEPVGTDEMEAALQGLGFCFILHTTLSHTVARPKFRVLLEVSEPVPARLYEKAMNWVVDRIVEAGIPRGKLVAALDEKLLKGSHVHQMYLPLPDTGHP